ncbi:hypothetical protein GCM10007984_05860 [Shewanella putrefaciens]|nr:hypothetical protein SPWS13_3830 [Shewanella putrefaciens]GGN10893.1 hypothetical protein GCM10007984_05860 [Shewanella putrefaciens]
MRSTTKALFAATSCLFKTGFAEADDLEAVLFVVTEADSAQYAVAATVQLLQTKIKLLSKDLIFI